MFEIWLFHECISQILCMNDIELKKQNLRVQMTYWFKALLVHMGGLGSCPACSYFSACLCPTPSFLFLILCSVLLYT